MATYLHEVGIHSTSIEQAPQTSLFAVAPTELNHWCCWVASCGEGNTVSSGSIGTIDSKGDIGYRAPMRNHTQGEAHSYVRSNTAE